MWREPIIWLVFGLPAATVVAAVAMIPLFGDSQALDEVRDEVHRTGQIQQTDLAPDFAARELGLSAHLRIADDAVELRPVSGTLPSGRPLVLTFAHPSLAAQDITLELHPEQGLWRASAHIDTTHDWKLQLQPGDGAWRLAGRLTRAEVSALLAPRLQAP
jgi:hypothetical protein